MPELPEVETICRGIAPFIKSKTIDKVIIRETRLRWPITRNLKGKLCGQCVEQVDRRGKYLLLRMREGSLVIHLGMSGRLRILPSATKAEKHDHVDIGFMGSAQILRFTDPRRFGAVMWVEGNPLEHKLLVNLGPEPLSKNFDKTYLLKRSCGRKVAVKSFIMDSHIVVGVGNIYANEALFLAGINPLRQTNSLDVQDCSKLVCAIKTVLKKAISAGGTTLRDFVSAEGSAGYFQQSLLVYGRGGQPCLHCGMALEEVRIGQRSTIYCSQCQN